MQLPNIQGCFVGRKRVAGRKTQAVSVVCCVSKKEPARRLAANQRVPKIVEWSDGQTFRGRFITDVQEISDGRRLAAVGGPGDLMSIALNNARATVGVALQHPTLGAVITTAAHAFLNQPGTIAFGVDGPAIQLAASTNGPHLPATARLAHWTAGADFALVTVSGSPTNLYDDSVLVRPPHWALPEDIGKLVFALTSRGPVPLRFEGATASLDLGGHPADRMLLTHPLTQNDVPLSGDSGCCLVDDQFRLWGLLVGMCVINARPHFVFMSPHWLFADGSTLL
jgi:hypothetical protein